MARSNTHRPFTPDPAQMALRPEISGNEINGLGEQTFRRPRMVYWAPEPSEIPHGAMQGYFYQQSAKVPAFGERRAQRIALSAAPLPPLAAQKRQADPSDWTKDLDQFAASNVCDKTGVAEMSSDWVFDGHDIPQSRVIMLGVQHRYDAIASAPAAEAGLEVVDQYIRAAQAAKTVADGLGHKGGRPKRLPAP